MLKADSIDVWPLNNAYGAVVNLEPISKLPRAVDPL
jgi:hypothetical protein